VPRRQPTLAEVAARAGVSMTAASRVINNAPHVSRAKREAVEKTWAAEVAAVRTKLLSWSTTLADKLHRVATTAGVPGIERVLEEATRDVLRELADPERPLPEVTPPTDGQAVAA